ncbi:hypothetical protein [Sinomonas flava]|uniref:hypothetical protein n=1 Tax=Sinomonas TaxID=596707 RepID=UPI0039A6AD6D
MREIVISVSAYIAALDGALLGLLFVEWGPRFPRQVVAGWVVAFAVGCLGLASL